MKNVLKCPMNKNLNQFSILNSHHICYYLLCSIFPFLLFSLLLIIFGFVFAMYSRIFSELILYSEYTHHKLFITKSRSSKNHIGEASFAQWHYHSLWSSTEAWWLLIENFSQYPAIRSEIPADMQCLKDPSGSITYNEIMVHQEMSPGEFPGEFEVQVTVITPSLLSF